MAIYLKWTEASAQECVASLHAGAAIVPNSFTNARTPFLISCEYGHIFRSKLYDIKGGHWCPYCKKVAKPTIASISTHIINTFNGTLLSSEYKNANSYLSVQCDKGHIFTTKWSYIQSGNWCSSCSGNKPVSLTDIQDYLTINHPGSLLVSSEYKNNKTKLSLLCEEKHSFSMTWNDISHGYWCPKCLTYKSENYCRQILENMLGVSFSKYRKYYDNQNKRKFYELDGLCETLQLGFEYNGKQHYEYVEKYHGRNKLEYLEQQSRDTAKLKYFTDLGYYIIIIPYDITYKNLKSFIEKEITLWQNQTKKV